MLWAAALLALLPAASAGSATHQYGVNEQVDLWVNVVGPFHNPHETYPYFSLPWCKPEGTKLNLKRVSLSEVLEGHELRNSGFVVQFGENSARSTLCTTTLTDDTSARFERAVDEEWWYEMYLDDLPMWGWVGEVSPDPSGKPRRYIYTHRRLDIAYNHNRVVEVNLTWAEEKGLVAPGEVLEFTYTVNWVPTTKPFHERYIRYLDQAFFEHKIHWFSIFNSFMMVVFLCGLVALILVRTLRNDFARYATDDDDVEGPGMAEDSGWKQVHGDVFRAPEHLVLFSALYGTGCQLTVLALAVVLYAVAGPLHGEVHEERGEVTGTIIVAYALTSFVAGYASAGMYKQHFSTPRAEQGSQWQRVMLLTTLLLPAAVGSVSIVVSTVSFYYDNTTALPLSAVLQLAGVWAFVALPLCVVGTLFGRHWTTQTKFPCRVNQIPRPIPRAPWYSAPEFIVCVAGLLPFGSVYLEVFFFLASVSSHKFLYTWALTTLVLIILILVVSCSTVVATYFLLNSENYRWAWLSFLSGASTGVYVLGYAMFYALARTEMQGIIQLTSYFSTIGLACFALSLMCGAVGVVSASAFVWRIFQGVKID